MTRTEDGEDDRQPHEEYEKEEEFGAGPDHSARDFTDTLSTIAQRNNKRAEIMNGTNKNRAENHPQQRR